MVLRKMLTRPSVAVHSMVSAQKVQKTLMMLS